MQGFTGKLIGRFGKLPIIATGLIVLMVCSAVALSGISIEHFYVALVLLGLGWNVGLIGGSSLLTSSVAADARVEVQGSADLTMSMCGALAAFGSGFVKESLGFHLLADAATALAAVLLVLAWRTAASTTPVSDTAAG